MDLSRVRKWMNWAALGENIPILISRAVLGFGFYLTGSGKIAHIDGVIKYFTSLGVPLAQFQAPFVARLEYYGAIALILGFLTRPIAFLLSSTMVVALYLADGEKFLTSWSPDSDIVPTEVTAFAYLVLLLWLVFRGGGLFSVDFGLWKLAERRFPSLRARP